MEHFESLIQRTCDWNTAVGNYNGIGVDAELEGSMLREEVEEIIQAIKDKNPTEVIDGVMDVLFVAIGTLHKMGADVPTDFTYWYQDVVKSNFTKFPMSKREDGKVKKSERFIQPEIYFYDTAVFKTDEGNVEVKSDWMEKGADLFERIKIQSDKL